MNTKLLSLLILFLGLTVSALAQTQGSRSNTSAPAAPAATGGSVPMAKIAMLDLALLRDGVAELKQRYEKLNAEFAGAGNELNSMQTTLDAKAKLLSDTSKMTQQQVAKLSDEYQGLKKEFERKQEDYEGLANKRAKEETDPIYTKILSFLDIYAKQHGITMVFEAGAARETQAIIFRAKPADITDDFIKEYNKAYPVAPAAPSAVKR